MRKMLLVAASLAFSASLAVACGGDENDDNDAKAGQGGSSAQQGASGSNQQGSSGQQGTGGSGGVSKGGEGGGGSGGEGDGALPLGPTYASLKVNVFLTKGCNNCHDQVYKDYDKLIAAKPFTGSSTGSDDESCTVDSQYNEETIIVKGDAEASLLYIKVARPTAEQPCGVRMPQASTGPEEPLSQEEIGALKEWIDNGANDN